MSEHKDAHRHVLPGGLLTGMAFFTEGEMHKHKLAGGEQWTSVVEGNSTDNHRHTANGQGTSSPTNSANTTQLEDKPSEAKQEQGSSHKV